MNGCHRLQNTTCQYEKTVEQVTIQSCSLFLDKCPTDGSRFVCLVTPENSGRPNPNNGQNARRKNNVTQHSTVFVKRPHTPPALPWLIPLRIKHAVEISTASYSAFPPINPTHTGVLQFFMVVEMYNPYFTKDN